MAAASDFRTLYPLASRLVLTSRRFMIPILLAIVVVASVWLTACAGESGIGGSTASDRIAPPQPTALKPGDDPSYDWEKPDQPQAKDSGSWTYAIKPNFSSSRTLEQTTQWLKWAIWTYGQVPGTPDTYQISDIKFMGCTMQWDAKRLMNQGSYVNETIYTVNLGGVDINYGALQANGSTLKLGTVDGNANSKIRIVEKFWEKDGWRMKSTGDRSSTDNSAVINLQDKDDISRRIGWALVHAVRLCGGKASR